MPNADFCKASRALHGARTLQGLGFRVQVLGSVGVQGVGEDLVFRVECLGLRVEGLGFRVYGLGFRVDDLGFRDKVWGLRFRTEGSGLRV